MAVFGGPKGEEIRELMERGGPLAGDSSRSSREDSLFAEGAALIIDYSKLSMYS